MWPEGTDGKFCFHPAFCHNPRDVPYGIALGTSIHLHIDIERARTGAVSAGQVVVEVNAVSVVLLQRGQEQVSFLPRRPPGAVHHHEGACRGKQRENKEWVCLAAGVQSGFAIRKESQEGIFKS